MDTFHFFIENPQSDDAARVFEHRPPAVQYASMDQVTHIRMVSGDLTEDNVRFVSRPDVAEKQRHLPFRHHVSFQSSKSIRTWLDGREQGDIRVELSHADSPGDTITIPIRKYRFREIKENKFETLAPLLCCPYCKKNAGREEKNFRCPACGRTFLHNGNAVDFLTDGLRAEFSIIDTGNVSDHGFEPQAIKAVETHPERLFLDVGAGFKYTCFENVINLEIVDYPSTDILGVGERLPFVNDSFDGVISSAVLEHVKDPFCCAAEIMRVLKPGGDLFCSAPFLQPHHGYPNHYYNMTSNGLVNLFPGLHIREIDVPYYLHPMAAITWILAGYGQGLPDDLRARFFSLKIEEIITLFSNFKSIDDPLLTRLSRTARFGLACGTFIHAVKPCPPGNQGAPSDAGRGTSVQ
jgi:SAM-dependent methyltransferase